MPDPTDVTRPAAEARTGAMYAETPNTLILSGALGASEMTNLTQYCQRLHRAGQASVQLDMSSVVDCHRAGLDGLLALRNGSTDLAVTVHGAHWAQFMVLLSASPIEDIQQLCHSARVLIDHPR